MRIAAVSHVEMTVDQARASAQIVMKTQLLQGVVLLGLGSVGLLCLLAPLVLIAVDAIANPQVVHSLWEHPGSTVMLIAGVTLGCLLLSFPLRSGFARLGGAATVRLAEGQVHVEQHGLLGTTKWSTPLTQFCGVTHHIRATLSGARHEIILVHPDPAKDVLLNLSSRHPQEDAAHFADLLGLGEVQPRTLYQRHRPIAEARPSVPLQARAA